MTLKGSLTISNQVCYLESSERAVKVWQLHHSGRHMKGSDIFGDNQYTVPTEFKMQGVEAERTDRGATLKLEKKSGPRKKGICSKATKQSLDSLGHRISVACLVRGRNA